MELLENINRSAHFNPYECIIDWGFPSLTPLPSLKFDLLNPKELSTCIHEFTHLDGMNSEMGLWYLHYFWELISLVFSKKSYPLMLCHDLFERFWFISILLEGQAMYAQLNLIPSEKIEATTKQYGFINNMAISYGLMKKPGISNVQNSVNDLFNNAQKYIHSSGLKKILLFSSKNSSYHYFLGYLFFKNIQAYLSQYNKEFKDPEIYFIFISNFLFNNIFSIFRENEPSHFAPFTAVIDIVRRIKLIAQKSDDLLIPILNYPNTDMDYGLIDYWKTYNKSKYVKKDSINDIAYKYIENLIGIDEYYANLFTQSAVSLGFYHLKSVDAHILGFSNNNSVMNLLCKYGKKKTICALPIRKKTIKIIKDLIARENCLILSEDIDALNEDEISASLNKFLECEVHIISRLQNCMPFTCIATRKDFIPILESFKAHEIWKDASSEFRSRGYPDKLTNKFIDDSSFFLDELLWHLNNSEYVRSRNCRNRIANHFITKLYNIDQQLHDQLNDNEKRSPVHREDEAKQNNISAFESVLFSSYLLQSDDSTSDNPIIQNIDKENTLPILHNYCLVPPNQIRNTFAGSESFTYFSDSICELFSGNLFFDKGVKGLSILDFL